MIKQLLIGIYCLLGTYSLAQYEWIHSFGNNGYDHCRDLKIDIDSNYVLTGSSSSFVDGSTDAYLMRVDTAGNFLWSYPYGGSGIDWGNALVITSDSSYAIAGYSNSSGAGGYDFYLVRTTSDGTPIWEKTYGGSDWDKAYDLVQLPDDGFILVGDTYSYGDSTLNGYMIRTDANGDTLWTKLFDGPGESYLRGVFLDAAGDSIVVAGGSEASGAGLMDGYVAKMDLDGNIGWESYIGTPSVEYFNDVYGDLGFYALGGKTTKNWDVSKDDIWMVKINDGDGSIVYDTTDASTAAGYDYVNAVTLNASNGELVYAGASTSWGFGTSDGHFDFYFGRHGIIGEDLQSHPVGIHGDDIAHAISITPDGGAIVAGDTKSYSTGGNNVLLYKMQSAWAYPDETMVVYDDITTGLEVNSKPSDEIYVYPNPSTGVINFKTDQPITKVEVLSLNGEVLMSQDVETKTIDLTTLQSGVYVFRLHLSDQVFTKRIVKR